MALLPILQYPDPKLHTLARPVQAVDARIQALIADMVETMYDANGIGLAATQVRVQALDGTGQSRTLEADGLLAVCIQHEMDHLMGKVFVEYLSPLKRNRIKSKMLKTRRALGRPDAG